MALIIITVKLSVNSLHTVVDELEYLLSRDNLGDSPTTKKENRISDSLRGPSRA